MVEFDVLAYHSGWLIFFCIMYMDWDTGASMVGWLTDMAASIIVVVVGQTGR